MQIEKRRKINWDFIGICLSLFCAVHCLLMPVLLSSLPFLGIEMLENKAIELVVLGLSLIAGSSALLNAYRKHHHQIWMLLVFLAGFLILAGSNLLTISASTEIILKLIALPMLLVAHSFNWYYCLHCKQHHI